MMPGVAVQDYRDPDDLKWTKKAWRATQDERQYWWESVVPIRAKRA